MSDLPFTITAPSKPASKTAAMTKWCEEKFGKRWSVTENRKGTWCCFWSGRSIPGTYKWHFKNEQDALLFSLTWL